MQNNNTFNTDITNKNKAKNNSNDNPSVKQANKPENCKDNKGAK